MRTMPRRFEAVVIGAGPAGAMAAYEIASSGKSVLILEKHPNPGNPLCCAEAVSQPSLDKIITPRPDWISTRIGRIKLISPDGNIAEIVHPEAGYVLDRKTFDSGLTQRAVQAGAELACNAIGVALKPAGDRFGCLEVLYPDGSTADIEADIFIAADGVESKIARLAGLDNIISDNDIESLLQYRITDIKVEPDLLEFYIGNQIAPRGYVWVFPKSENSANVGLGIAASLEKGDKTVEYLERFLKKRFGEKYRIAETHCGLVPRYQGQTKFRLKNLLVIGDAARAVDSLSGAGIVNAMLSGIYAGRAAAVYIASGGMREEALESLYPGEFFRIKKEELQTYLKLREVFNKLSDADFNDIVGFLKDYFAGKTVYKLQPMKIITSMALNRPRLLGLLRHLI